MLKWLSPASPEWLMLGLVLVTLIAVRRAHTQRTPARRFKTFMIIVLGLCTFVALMAGYARDRNLVKPQPIPERGRAVKGHMPGALR